jgi:hypothetical protein
MWVYVEVSQALEIMYRSSISGLVRIVYRAHSLLFSLVEISSAPLSVSLFYTTAKAAMVRY